MVTYSIKDLEKLSGIKAHTIRMWEQRYRVIEPRRTATNIRYYTDEDLKCLLNIALLNRNGLRISQIARMSREEMSERVQSITESSMENGNQLQALTMAMVELNEERVEQIIDACVEQWGFEGCVQMLFIPFLEKLSLLWLTGSIGTVHEQFVHCIIRRKLEAETERLPRRVEYPHYKFLLYLPKGEHQDLEVILLLVRYLLRREGYPVIYLGMGISVQDLILAYDIHRPPYIYSILSGNRVKPSLSEYLQKVTEVLPHAQFIFSGYQSDMSDLPEAHNLHLLDNFDATIDFLDTLSSSSMAQGHS